MWSQAAKNIWTTKFFFVVRLAASLAIAFVYLIFAAAVQYYYVTWFGESTFNYLVGGALSLCIGALVCHYLGLVVFAFVRGWHMGALALAPSIRNRNLPVLYTGMSAFRKHFTSLAAVYGIGIFVKRFADKGAEKLWTLLKDVPYLGALKNMATNPIAVKLAEDILNTGFDAAVFYLIRYSKPGLSDDYEVIKGAIKKYLCALPSIMLSSLTLYLMLHIVPRVLKWFTVFSVIMSQGLVSGILINVLMFPVFYVLRHAVFEPLETIVLVSCFANQCKEDPIEMESWFSKIIDGILADLGFEDEQSDEEEGTAEVTEESESEAETESEMEHESTRAAAVAQPSSADMLLDVEPDIEDDDDSYTTLSSLFRAPAAPRFLDSIMAEETEQSVEDLPIEEEQHPRSLTALFRAQQMQEQSDGSSEEEEGAGQITRLFSAFNSISAADLNADLDGDPMGGGSIDLD